MASKHPHDLINETIHQRTRLAIMASLTAVESLDFSDLKAQLGLTDGNLSAHLAALEHSGFVAVEKSFVGKKPRTTIHMKPKGRTALERYINLLQTILDKARQPRP